MTRRRYELTDHEWSIISPPLPNKPRGVPWADDRRVLNGILWRFRTGSPWAEIPERYGPPTTCYNRFVRWRRAGVWDRLLAAVSAAYDGDIVMIDSTCVRVHQYAATGKKGMFPRRIGRTKGGLNSKLHAVCDGRGRPLVMLLSEGQMSDYGGARLMIPHLPPAKELLADKGYDADWLRKDLAERGIAACIPSRAKQKSPIPHNAVLYRERHKIEIMFGRLKDWRRIATRYERCAHTFFSAICIAAAVTFYL
ncbi:IS5 family transposase [Pseudochelatococcus lubricantis]|uniref:IS5 family transposase n=1 Tax=Pseudochelatococcus lubricantis TaxID=1538102 RepID=UPI0035E9E7B2